MFGKVANVVSRSVAAHPLVWFFSLAYLGSWTAILWMLLLDGPDQLMAVFGMSPLVAALITQRVAQGNWRAFRVAGPWRRTLASTVVGIASVTLAFVILPAVLVVDVGRLNWSALGSVSLLFSTSPLAGPLPEEPAWRGFALPLLEAEYGATRGSLILGVLWATWHLPLFLVPGFSSASFLTFVLIVLGHSTLLAFATNLARFSVIPAIAMHWVFNNSSAVISSLLANVEPSRELPFELVMGLCGLVVALGVIVVTKGKLAYKH